jgi:serine/threonine protein kinase
MDASTPVRPGDRIAGKYRVDGILGEGGMGIVVSATHEQLDQKVALKFLQPGVVHQPDLVARFLREARAAVKIHASTWRACSTSARSRTALRIW